MARRSNAARRDASAARRREGIRSQPLRAERRGVLQVAGAALLWSLGGIGIKAIAEPPLKIAAYRSATAAVALFLVTAERLRTTDAGRLDTADLVVEALSAGSATYDRTAKADTYAALGVRERWLVDLERRAIEQRVLEAGRWRVAGVHAGSAAFEAAVFPGLTVVPEDVFAPA